MGDHALVGELTDENIARSVEGEIKIWEAFSLAFRTSHLNGVGDHSGALASIGRGLPLLDAGRTKLFRPLVLSFKLDALLALGRYDEATSVLQAIERQIEVSAERWNQSDIRRIEGDLCLAQGMADDAKRSYQQAMVIAQQQSAKSFELRAATKLARLRADRGERQQAQDLLTPVYDWFTEGFDTPDLMTAKALLDELS